MLEAFLAQECLGHVDFALADHFLAKKSRDNESVAAFLCHLSMAARQGHLCVVIEGDNIDPDPAVLWVAPKGGEVAHDYAKLSAMILDGARQIGDDLLAVVDKPPTRMAPVYKHGSRYYFQRNWVLETHFINNYAQLQKTATPYFKVDVNRVSLDHRLLPEQAQAILHGCSHCLTVITGGPGTGKTYTAGTLLRVLWDHIADPKCKVVVTAPTGKAAAHLEKSILRAMEGSSSKPVIKAQTLHSLLGVKDNRQVDRHLRIDGDIIIVDECSMIDVWIMGDLMGSIKPGARLIMLGDTSQLPPVEGGSIFSDIVKTLDGGTTHLSVCQRAELQDIVHVAGLIDKGKSYEVIARISWQGGEGIVGIDLSQWNSPLQAQNALVQAATEKYAALSLSEQDPHLLMNQFASFRVLSPVREGRLGVDELNKKIYGECVRRMPRGASMAAPIMITKNDHKLNVFNGDMGVLMGNYAYLPDRTGASGYRKLAVASLPAYEYAYCLSIHKSQGSEFDAITLVVPEGSDVFGREALYTAATRARVSGIVGR